MTVSVRMGCKMCTWHRIPGWVGLEITWSQPNPSLQHEGSEVSPLLLQAASYQPLLHPKPRDFPSFSAGTSPVWVCAPHPTEGICAYRWCPSQVSPLRGCSPSSLSLFSAEKLLQHLLSHIKDAQNTQKIIWHGQKGKITKKHQIVARREWRSSPQKTA